MKVKYNFTKSIYLLLSFFILFAFCGCEKITFFNKPDIISIGFCIDILGVDNTSFAKPVLAALESASRKEQISLSTIVCKNKNKYKESLIELSDNNDLVIASHFMIEELTFCAQENTQTHFVIFNSYSLPSEKTIVPSTSNITYFVFSEENAAEIAGFISSEINNCEPSGIIFSGYNMSPLRNRIYNSYVSGVHSSHINSTKTVCLFSDEDLDFAQNERISFPIESSNLKMASLYYMPSILYASMLNETRTPLDSNGNLPWDIILLGSESLSYPTLGGIIRKNYSKAIETIISNFSNKSLLGGVVSLGRVDGYFKFSPINFKFSDESLIAINSFLSETKSTKSEN
ncbi:MAG: hypothetical protein KAH01_02095 [Caldisericia bacterium]|nr:hypothetical protein [Caldisericia bacterium]